MGVAHPCRTARWPNARCPSARSGPAMPAPSASPARPARRTAARHGRCCRTPTSARASSSCAPTSRPTGRRAPRGRGRCGQRGDQPLALLDEPLPQRGTALGEPRAARRRTPACPRGSRSGPGRSPRSREVVRRGAHVELADVAGELEAVRDQVRGHHRGEPEGVLVEVHPGVQAARLLERRPVVAAGRQRVARTGASVKKRNASKCEQRDPVRLDHRVGAGAARAAAAAGGGSRPCR